MFLNKVFLATILTFGLNIPAEARMRCLLSVQNKTWNRVLNHPQLWQVGQHDASPPVSLALHHRHVIMYRLQGLDILADKSNGLSRASQIYASSPGQQLSKAGCPLTFASLGLSKVTRLKK